MATRRSACTVAIIQILLDGEWHSKRDLALAGAPFVPPVQAITFRDYRAAAKQRQREAHGLKTRSPLPATREDKVKVGAYGLARSSVTNMMRTRKGYFETNGECIRLKPEGIAQFQKELREAENGGYSPFGPALTQEERKRRIQAAARRRRRKHDKKRKRSREDAK